MYPPPKRDSTFSLSPHLLPNSSQSGTADRTRVTKSGPGINKPGDQMGHCFSKPTSVREPKAKIASSGSGRRALRRHVPKLPPIPERGSSASVPTSRLTAAPQEQEDFPSRAASAQGGPFAAARLLKFGNGSVADLRAPANAAEGDDKCSVGDDCPYSRDLGAAGDRYDPFADFDSDSAEQQDDLEECPELEQVVNELITGSQQFAIHVEDRIAGLQTDLEMLKQAHELNIENAKKDSTAKEADIMTLMRLMNRMCEKCDMMETEVRRLRRHVGAMSVDLATPLARQPSKED